MTKYKNPIVLKKGDKRANAGDPFVLKYDGEYYLYTSTESDSTGISCYKSRDLVNWEYQNEVTDEPITINAYAPEVIFYKDKFYLVTSPGGNGHYLFVSKSPLGPFERVSENIGNMIDGSFYKENGKLYLSRANHFGISIHEVTDDFKLINRIDLNAEMHGWTEGSFIIKRKDNYFMTYCGNNLFADTYRVDYSHSKNLLGPYTKGINNSIINKLNKNYKALGHSAIIKGPDLDTYYNVYHKLSLVEDYSIRDYCIDRLDIQGDILKQNLTDKLQKYPVRPSFESYLDNHNKDFAEIRDFYLTREETSSEYVSEFNFKGNQISLVFGYSVNSNYEIRNYLSSYGLFKAENNKEELIALLDLKISAQCLNKIELRQSNKLEIIVNDEQIKVFDIISKGKLGYRKVAEVSYIAYSNYLYRNVNGVQTLPNLVFCEDSLGERTIKIGDKLHFSVTGQGEYLVSGMMKVKQKIRLRIGVSEIEINSNDSPYELNKEIIDKLYIEGETSFTVEVLKGIAEFNYLEFEKTDNTEVTVVNTDELLQETYNIIPTNEYNNRITTNLEILERHKKSRYGLLINVSQFSEFVHQASYPFKGYFIGFYQDLLVIDKVNFGIKRIFDIPFKLDSNKCSLEVRIVRNKISVYVNNLKIIECYDQYIKNTGQIGTYSCELSKTIFRDTLGGILDE
jgi:hypothetical protein